MSWGSRVVTLTAVLGTAACSTPLPPLQWLTPADHAFVIPTGAMEPTLQIGDRIVVEAIDRTAPSIQRGEIIVLTYPVDQTQTFIKRVVGIPGDRIRLSHKKLFLNGRPVEEPYVVHKTEYEDAYRDNFPAAPNVQVFEAAMEMLEKNVDGDELVVPDGSYFVLGDNRDLSLDSRYWGFVPEDLIIGKPWGIYYAVNLDENGERTGINWSRIGQAIESYPLGEKP